MKRMLVVGGSVGLVILLVMAMFPAVVSAQTMTFNKKIARSNQIDIKSLKEKQKILPMILSQPGRLIQLLFTIIAGFLYWIFLNFHS